MSKMSKMSAMPLNGFAPRSRPELMAELTDITWQAAYALDVAHVLREVYTHE
eukprot:CAMPEP_0181172788 /NCGR_PEP_ID=MMETSP1096-20121128/2636_1 /TAXON_ID=156174 ORGANISM="Chrysochromulina ericina, Strain CCMP281" /NCGR_SAMPLE_ID=MMETSP1096 /ASSEMBLY_ACC=CAM_ASM_000453 /LENGTH=51 /DNA_ID=CAMNT_0023260539 /DNA_START=168 /DNA_END=323 /DNA_ORIENTATION=+